MPTPDLASFIAAPDHASDPRSAQRLERSAAIIKRNVDTLTDRVIQRCPSIQIAQSSGSARARLHTFLSLILDHPSDPSAAQQEIAALGSVFPDLAHARVTIVAQMSAIAGYTWTSRLSMDWTRTLALAMSWTDTPHRQSA